MRLIPLLLFICLAFQANGQGLKMKRLGDFPASETLIEFEDFIIYKGDTLNRRGDFGMKTGLWMEYRKSYVQRVSGSKVTVDSTRISYILDAKGSYVYGMRKGLWETYHENGELRDSVRIK